MAIIKSSALFVILSFTLLRSSCLAVKSDSEFSVKEIKPSDVELRVFPADEVKPKKPEPVVVDDVVEIPAHLGDDEEKDKADDNDDEQPSVPSFSHVMNQVSAAGNVIVSKVFSCDNHENFQQVLNQVYNSRTLAGYSFTDVSFKRYLNGNLYKQRIVSHTNTSNNQVDIAQSARQCSGGRIVQGARIVLDCPAAWCGPQISVMQFSYQSTSSYLSQLMELYVVCPKGAVPRVALNRRSFQNYGRTVQNFKTIALYSV